MIVSERVFPKRPELLDSATTHVETPIGSAYVTVGFHDSRPIEVFLTIGKTGSVERAFAEAIGRLLSVALQHDVPLEVLTRQLRGISSEETLGLGPNKVLSAPDAVGRILENYNKEER